MIHPSTLAGPNWFTGSIGTTHPFQQSTTPFFRNAQVQGPQVAFAPGIPPIQPQSIGPMLNTTQMLNTINEIVRQTVPLTIANGGFQPTAGFQTPFGFPTPLGQQGPHAFQTPLGPSFPTGAHYQQPQLLNTTPIYGNWQNQTQSFIPELIRQATGQVIQTLYQQNPALFSQAMYGQTQPIHGIGMQYPGQNIYGTGWQQQQHYQNFVAQVCQAVASCVNECLNQQAQTQNTLYSTPNTPYYTQSTPFNATNPTAQYSTPTGVPCAGVL
jgi:hypothetical protein